MSLSQIIWGVIGLASLITILAWLREEWREARKDQQTKWPYF